MDVARSVEALVEADWIDCDRRFAAGDALGPGAMGSLSALAGSGGQAPTSTPTTTSQDAAGGCDGVKNGLWGFHVASGEQHPWWQVDLGREYRLDRVVIYNRCDAGESRTAHLQILVAKERDGQPEGQFTQVYQHDGRPFYGVEKEPLVVRFDDRPVAARVVRLRIPGRCSFALDEVEVYAADDPETNVALGKPADQISTSQYSRPGTMSDAEFIRIGYTPLVARGRPGGEGGGFSLAHTRDIVDRGHQLAGRLRSRADAKRLEPLLAKLATLDERVTQMESAPEVPEQARRETYLEARRLVRQIAFTNPLLDFDKILFIKRHDSAGVFHMCDQYYGCNAVPGGGLFVLTDPFGPDPKLVNLLEDSLVEDGRLKGQRLEGGTFLSPELSFDGTTILFAYSQAKAWNKYQGKEAYEWTPECSYHVFKCNADGSGLVQLTDGPRDDFDPCFLPNGRIAFVSERRGGYLRCGRHCPVYTMFSMDPDGGDIANLSFHETHEWHPSVTNDGMIVYSRWDYVDRDTNIAHHIWTCFPDGRNPRSYHGNYPHKRESRPWMEMSIRAVPGSNKFVAATGAHHGNAFGSLVLIDPRIEDDGATSQLVRLTPDVPFPEAEGRPIRQYMAYGTPWPLDEDDYLCVYDPHATNRGIYWIDRFGNKELFYRDPEISCLSPIPLRSRPTPPVIPDQTARCVRSDRTHAGLAGLDPMNRVTTSLRGLARLDARADKLPMAPDKPPVAPDKLPMAPDKLPFEPTPTGTVAVMSLYDSDFTWPEGTRITDLRVIQLLPKSTPPPNEPRIGVANQTNARAVLGTVPVGEDGSVYFEAPAGVPVYFQALDRRGMAVESMRSVTYVQPGERLVCQGCHEPKHRPPSRPVAVPLALARPPSRIRPEADGSNPFNYVRLVQPVLDRNCVSCHQEKKALDLTGNIAGANGWTQSYQSLAAKYGFYFHVSNGSINTGVHGGSRTIPGQFGAKAAPLLAYLNEAHYDVKLSDEDFHRLVLWLDCNSEFYGSYENTEAQARGEVVMPTLE